MERMKQMYPPFMPLFIPGLVMLGLGVYACYYYSKLMKSCDTPVNGFFVRYSVSSPRRSAAMPYWPIFSYTVKGTNYTLRGNGIATPLYSEGDMIELLYNPQNPKKCYAIHDKQTKNRSGWILIFFGIAWILLSVLLNFPPL